MRLLIDCTNTAGSDVKTGIQRVVRNIARHIEGASKIFPVSCSMVTIAETGLVECSPDEANQVRNKRSRAYVGLTKFYDYLRSVCAVVLPLRRIQAFLYAPRDQFGLTRILRSLLLMSNEPDPVQLSKLIVAREDVLVLLDSTWHLDIWDTVRDFKRQGGTVIVVIYDLIPISHPRYCDRILHSLFCEWFLRSLGHADGYLCISQSVAEEVERYVTDGLGIRKGRYQIGHFRLGFDLDLSSGTSRVREAIARLYAGDRNVFLAVGTIEPRKNHAVLLDAFERLWNAGVDVRLCIIGKMGWVDYKFRKRLLDHPYLGNKLFVFTDANDHELDMCYKSSLALIMPSRAEGFGLPIVEALSRGLPVIASDIPVHREVGGGFIATFDPDSAEALTDLVQRTTTAGRVPGTRPIGEFSWMNWNSCTREFIEKVTDMDKQIRAVRAYERGSLNSPSP